MKRHILLLCLLVLYFIPNVVKADSTYTTGAGTVMLASDYNKLRKLYTDEYISTMDATEYYNLMTMGIDFENISTTIIYVRETINHITGEITLNRITEEEYEQEPITSQDRSIYVETNDRRLSLSLAPATDTLFIATSLLWKQLPTVRSFDDIGLRIIHASMVMGTQSGKQIYKSNGTTSYVNYSYNGTNSKYFSNGFGISMNLVDNATEIQQTISVSATITSYPVTVYASSQHATSNITLATAKNYTLGGGYGEVFVFNGSTGNYYDGFYGVHSSISS